MNVRDRKCIMITIISFLAGICQTTLALGNIGSVTEEGTWKWGYKSCFSFIIKERTYYHCAQNEGGYRFIQELLPGGKFGPVTDERYGENQYMTSFTYAIDGKQYIFGLAHDIFRWYIAELLEGGKMGPETDSGTWRKAYETCFPFHIGTNHYYHCQNTEAEWFIQKLLPGGKMGSQIVSKKWTNYWSMAVLLPFESSQYAYFYNKATSQWFTRELYSSLSIVDEGSWDSQYEVGFSYKMSNRLFFMGLATEANHNYWYIQEVRRDGKFGGTCASGTFPDSYDVLVPFEVGGEQFFFATSSKTHKYRVQKLV